MKLTNTLLADTAEYYRKAAEQETNPVIKAHYQKQYAEMLARIKARATNPTTPKG